MAQSNPSYEELLLSEEDIKLRYITPAILSKDWSVKDITMEAKVKESSPKRKKRCFALKTSFSSITPSALPSTRR